MKEGGGGYRLKINTPLCKVVDKRLGWFVGCRVRLGGVFVLCPRS